MRFRSARNAAQAGLELVLGPDDVDGAQADAAYDSAVVNLAVVRAQLKATRRPSLEYVPRHSAG